MFIFYVSATLADADIGALPIFEHLSKLQEVKLKSKQFSSFKECIDSGHALVSDVIGHLNKSSKKYYVQAGNNPIYQDEDNTSTPGIGELSKWSDHEMSRLYILNADQCDDNGIYLTKFVVSFFNQPQNNKKAN